MPCWWGCEWVQPLQNAGSVINRKRNDCVTQQPCPSKYPERVSPGSRRAPPPRAPGAGVRKPPCLRAGERGLCSGTPRPFAETPATCSRGAGRSDTSPWGDRYQDLTHTWNLERSIRATEAERWPRGRGRPPETRGDHRVRGSQRGAVTLTYFRGADLVKRAWSKHTAERLRKGSTGSLRGRWGRGGG